MPTVSSESYYDTNTLQIPFYEAPDPSTFPPLVKCTDDPITYSCSGAFGDIIYGLAVIPKLGNGHFKMAMNNLKACAASFGYDTSDRWMGKMHQEYFQDKHYDLLEPLLLKQPYITGVSKWHKGDPKCSYNFDDFRGLLFKRFEGNYLEAFYRTFQIPFEAIDVHAFKWLVADREEIAPIVVLLYSIGFVYILLWSVVIDVNVCGFWYDNNFLKSEKSSRE